MRENPAFTRSGGRYRTIAKKAAVAKKTAVELNQVGG